METLKAIQAIIADSGESNRALSAKMGKSSNYLNSAIEQSKRKGGDFYGQTIASVADVCGYALALVPRRDVPQSAIVIDPPEKG